MIGRLFFALVALALVASSASAALPGANGYQGGDVVDVRAFGAKCANNSAEDDTAALTAAYAKLSSTGGGTLVIPAGGVCYVASDVQVEDNVALHCEPGGTIKATAAGAFTLGMLRWIDGGFQNQNNTAVSGCTFDLNGLAETAVQASGAGIVIEDITVQNGDASASAYSLVTYSCTGGGCRFADSTITCANTAGANDTGLSVAALSATGAATIENNAIIGCEGVGITTASPAVIRGNTIASDVASAVGISTASATSARVVDNAFTMSGTTAKAAILGPQTIFSGNALDMDAATGGTEAQIALDVTGIATRIIGNTIVFAVDENNTGIAISNQHTRIVGNYILGGKYGVAPSESSGTARAAGINAYIDSNEIWGIGGIGVVAITGWMVANNYISWLESNAFGVVIGDVRGAEKLGNNHATINNNRLHSMQSGAKGVVFALGSNEICQSGTSRYQSCTADTTVACPGGTCGDCCNSTGATHANIVITGNEFLFAAGSQGPLVDIGAGVGANGQTITNVMIDGNSVSMDSNDTYISFPSSNQTKVTKIWVADAPVGTGTFVANFTAAQGSLLSFEQVVADLPAAGCVGTSASSFWNLPASNPAVAACWGTNYVRGVLGFSDGGGGGAARSAYTDFMIPTIWLGTLYVDVWWGNNNTTSCNVVWQVSGVCVTDDDGEDPAFSSTANTVTVAVDPTNQYDVDKATITLSNAANNPLNTCAAGEVMHLRLFRDPAHASDSCTTSTASVYRAVVRQW